MDNGHHAPPAGVRPVLVLLFVNLGLSVVLTGLLFFLRDSVLDYQFAHVRVPPGTDLDATRALLRQQVWLRAGGTLVVSALYLRIGYRLRRGHRAAYRRVVLISCVGLAGLAVLLATSHYPAWVRVEQVVQAGVLAALLWFVTRPGLRAGLVAAGSQ